MSNTKLVIIIPGSQAKIPFVFKQTFFKLYKHFGIEYGHDDWALDLKKHIETKTKIDVKIFDWSRGITKTFSLNPAIKKLTRLLEKTQHDYKEIILFGKSFGGFIAQEAIKNFDSRKFHLIYVASPHKRNKLLLPQALSITNIYSENDQFQKLAIILFYFGFGSRALKNAENISLANIKHSDFNRNINVSYNGHFIKLFDFYTNIILTRKDTKYKTHEHYEL